MNEETVQAVEEGAAVTEEDVEEEDVVAKEDVVAREDVVVTDEAAIEVAVVPLEGPIKSTHWIQRPSHRLPNLQGNVALQAH